MAEEALESHRLCRNEELSHKIWNLLPIQLFHLIKSKETSKSSLASSDSQFPKERATVLTDLNNSQGLESFCLKKTGGREGGFSFWQKTANGLLKTARKESALPTRSLQRRGSQSSTTFLIHSLDLMAFSCLEWWTTRLSPVDYLSHKVLTSRTTPSLLLLQPFMDGIVQCMTLLEMIKRATPTTAN